MARNRTWHGMKGGGRSVAAALLALLLLATAVPGSARQEGDAERLQRLEQEVQELRRALAELAAEKAQQEVPEDDRLTELERRLEVLAGELERLEIGEAAAEAEASEFGFGPAASKIYRTARGVSLGGYGEMLYESFDSARDDGVAAGERDELDFLRAIFYIGYKFNDRWLFNSEIEFEHASTGKSGEASVEFAYLDYLHRPGLNARFGMVLVPMGLVNELHEPTVFLGALRPDVERVIIPSTWRENGFGLFGDAGSVSYRVYLVNGLRADGFGSGGLRGGRQKGSKALAEDFALVGRLDYDGVPGLILGGSVYFGDSGQGLTTPGGAAVDVGTTIWEGHLLWSWRNLELGGLVTRAELDDVPALNAALGLSGNRSVGEALEGYYLQASYDVFRRGEMAITPYVRFESYDTQAEVPPGFVRDPARDVESLTLGVAYQPLERIIFKLDYKDLDNGAGTGLDQLNVAIGYVF